jgi:hypothetical protein
MPALPGQRSTGIPLVPASSMVTENAAYGVLAPVLLFAVVLTQAEPALYRALFDREDRFAEIASFLVLLFLGFLCMRRALLLRAQRGLAFAGFCALYGAGFLVLAGEEISWGQRLFDLQTPDWLERNNRQEELNFHNIVVGGAQVADYMYPALALP